MLGPRYRSAFIRIEEKKGWRKKEGEKKRKRKYKGTAFASNLSRIDDGLQLYHAYQLKIGL